MSAQYVQRSGRNPVAARARAIARVCSADVAGGGAWKTDEADRADRHGMSFRPHGVAKTEQ